MISDLLKLIQFWASALFHASAEINSLNSSPVAPALGPIGHYKAEDLFYKPKLLILYKSQWPIYWKSENFLKLIRRLETYFCKVLKWSSFFD